MTADQPREYVPDEEKLVTVGMLKTQMAIIELRTEKRAQEITEKSADAIGYEMKAMHQDIKDIYTTLRNSQDNLVSRIDINNVNTLAKIDGIVVNIRLQMETLRDTVSNTVDKANEKTRWYLMLLIIAIALEIIARAVGI